MIHFLSSFAKSIDRHHRHHHRTHSIRESERREREKSLRENFMKIEYKTRRHIVTKKPQNIVLLLYYRMLFTSSATFVGAFAGVCTQMYACALRKVPLFHREYYISSSFSSSSSSSSSASSRCAICSLFNLARFSLSLSLFYIYKTHDVIILTRILQNLNSTLVSRSREHSPPNGWSKKNKVYKKKSTH